MLFRSGDANAAAVEGPLAVFEQDGGGGVASGGEGFDYGVAEGIGGLGRGGWRGIGDDLRTGLGSGFDGAGWCGLFIRSGLRFGQGESAGGDGFGAGWNVPRSQKRDLGHP